MTQPLNIIIPLAGSGVRFAEAGFLQPKPLVRARGEAILFHCIRALNPRADDNVVLVYHRHLEAFNFSDLVRREFPNLQIRFVSLVSDTRGAAETVLLGLGVLDEATRSLPTLVADGDSLFLDSVLEQMREQRANCIFFFEDRGNDPIYSYITMNEDGTAAAIEEKERISNNACSGAYGFESAEVLLEYCDKTIDSGRRSKGEFYMSNVYKTMLDEACTIRGHKIDKWECLGTPAQLRYWTEHSQAPVSPYRFCFDLDNTLVSHPKINGAYGSCEPIERNVRYLRFLKESGHYIIIHTARGMRTHQGDVSAVVEDIMDLTKLQLDRFGIPYDELVFGKPYAHFYVDDLAVLPQASLENQIGFYMDSEVAPRPWHSITWKESTVEKRGLPENIASEVAWYSNLPEEVRDLAPRLIQCTEESLEIERISGIPVSQLHVNGVVQASDLEEVLHTLARLHAAPIENNADIYANYGPKIRWRYQEFDWGRLPESGRVYDMLTAWAEDYASADRGRLGLIHGDPVFTNVLMTPRRAIKLIDPRGELGGVITMAGDIFYDLAKVYQSLIGYDAILHEAPLTRQTELTDHFHEYVTQKFGEQTLRDVQMITASLLFSLIPLHRRELHADFLELAASVADKHEWRNRRASPLVLG